MERNENEVPSKIRLYGAKIDLPNVEQMANFMRDLVFLHDRLWLIENRSNSEFNPRASYFYTRYGRSVPERDRLKLISIRMESPWEMAVFIGSALAGTGATAWAFFQILRGALLLPGELRLQQMQELKAHHELQKLVAENASGHNSEPAAGNTIVSVIRALSLPEEKVGPAESLIQGDVRRLHESPLRLVEIEIIESIRPKQE
jgi:hypothetical protein